MYRWINKLAQNGVIIGGVSGGPIILVKAGLMKEHRMTVHWEHAPSLLEISHDIILEKAFTLLIGIESLVLVEQLRLIWF